MAEATHDQKVNLQNNKKPNSYIEYSTVSFQMLAVIFLFAFAGNKIDAYLTNPKPIVTAISSIIGVAIAMYIAIKKIKQ